MTFDQKELDLFLEHHGVKGMHWGVHRARSQAKSDANEFVKAKLFYGEGAGTRRKLIKARVESRSKASPHYKKAFEEHVANQNLDKRASQAVRTRHRKDATNFTRKTVRGVHRSLTGGFGPVTVTAAAIAAGAAYFHNSGADRVLLQKASSALRSSGARQTGQDWLRQNGIRF